MHSLFFLTARALLFVSLLAACANVFAIPLAPPEMRLPEWVKPLAYDIELTIRPDKADFDGRLTIEIELTGARDFLWIHARDLSIRQVQAISGGETIAARVEPGNTEIVGLRFASRLPAGRARLEFNYSGKLDAINTRGLFRQQDAGEWYVFSQFEPISARRAFPCFDEPRWKSTWKIALTVRNEHVAVANMPVARETVLADGMKRVEFATTPPLSSYLVAFGVGPFDVVEGGSAGKNQVPLRYITPKGRGAEAAYAAQVTPDLLVLLEEYFGRPYPFAKLDSMVIPVTVNFGAMENAGLITYRSSLMLAPRGGIDERFQQRYASIAAHEIAHQWFGNLVTMNWWNDIWLNESFATWMARKVVARFNPSWEEQAGRLHERNEAIAVDRLESTRQIRQAVERQDDLSNAFDRITYSKGGAVLTMFESWLGEERFRAGVRRYLDKHAFANASAEDFFAALAQSDQELARAFQSFVEQPGVPQVAHGLECSDGKAALTLAQQRFRPLPSSSAADHQAWRIPVCVRYAGQDGAAPLCHLLDTNTARIPLPGASRCPAWVLPNPGGIGYYLSTLSAPLLTALASTAPTAAESAALLSDLDLLARAGALPYDQVLRFAAAQSGGPPQAALAAVAVLHGMHPALLEGEEKSSFATWVRKHFGERARSLGWLPQADESDATQRLRRALLPLLSDVGADAELRANAQTLATAWLKGEQALGAMRLPLLGSAARNADAAFFEALAGKAKQASDSSERNDIYQALGGIADAALRELAFLLVLDPGHDARESVSILQNAANSGDYAVSLQTFLQSRYDELLSRLPADYGARLPELGRLLCDANARNAFEAWFAPRAKKYPGGKRNFAQALESIDICLASRSAQRKHLANFLVGAH